jgi:hypothetical protein
MSITHSDDEKYKGIALGSAVLQSAVKIIKSSTKFRKYTQRFKEVQTITIGSTIVQFQKYLFHVKW